MIQRKNSLNYCIKENCEKTLVIYIIFIGLKPENIIFIGYHYIHRVKTRCYE